jgi:prophage regulatory protein
MMILSYDDLRTRGIPYSRVHIWRLERAGQFPKRVPIGPARHGWLEAEISDWIAGRAAARDAATTTA